MKSSLASSGQTINYTLKKSLRTRNLRVAIYCDSRVVVTAPVYFPESLIKKFLIKKIAWIENSLKKFKGLKITAPNLKNKRGYKKYKKPAYDFVVAKVTEVNKIYNFSYNKITVRNQKTRWGSCSQKRNLNFNYKIIFLPEKLAEYLVAHELCHLQEFNHSARFWDLVSRAVPDYKKLMKQMKKQLI